MGEIVSVRWLQCLLRSVSAIAGIGLVFVSGALGFVEPGITGRSSDFVNCPVNVITAGIEIGGGHCLHSVTTGGVVQIGNSSVPISVPGDTFDVGGTQEEPEEGPPTCSVIGAVECVVSPPHGLLNGPTQPVPGGLLGTVGNVQLTGVTAKLEWASPLPPDTVFGTEANCKSSSASVTFDLCRLLNGVSNTAVTLSVKIHLMSPFLGTNCFVGSSAHPIVIPLTTGVTSPPPPTKPIHGKPYEFLLSKTAVLELVGITLVSNTFSVPAATGCGTSSGSLVDASINHKLGLPSAAGRNMIEINGTGEEWNGLAILEAGWKGE